MAKRHKGLVIKGGMKHEGKKKHKGGKRASARADGASARSL